MTTPNLWGNLGQVEAERTPTLILREQANILRELTNGVLEGEVRRRNIGTFPPSTRARMRQRKEDDYDFEVSLYITSPALDRYRLKIIDVFHDIDLYPISLYDSVNNQEYECVDEVDFLSELRRILSSERVQRAIGILIAESNAEEV